MEYSPIRLIAQSNSLLKPTFLQHCTTSPPDAPPQIKPTSTPDSPFQTSMQWCSSAFPPAHHQSTLATWKLVPSSPGAEERENCVTLGHQSATKCYKQPPTTSDMLFFGFVFSIFMFPPMLTHPKTASPSAATTTQQREEEHT